MTREEKSDVCQRDREEQILTDRSSTISRKPNLRLDTEKCSDLPGTMGHNSVGICSLQKKCKQSFHRDDKHTGHTMCTLADPHSKTDKAIIRIYTPSHGSDLKENTGSAV